MDALINDTKNKNIGNQDLVQNALAGIDEDEDLRRAIEESLSFAQKKSEKSSKSAPKIS